MRCSYSRFETKRDRILGDAETLVASRFSMMDFSTGKERATGLLTGAIKNLARKGPRTCVILFADFPSQLFESP